MEINFAHLMEHTAVRWADREALVNIERNRRYSYRELHALTNRIVNMMRSKLALHRGDTYLCILENDNLSLLHTWTALKGEAAAAFTNLRDPFDDHRWQVDFMRPKVVFLENDLLHRYYPMLRALGATVVCMDALPPGMAQAEGLHAFWDLLEDESEDDPGVESDIHASPLLYRFTGGTTGRSKCAAYTMDNWLACRDAFFAEAEHAIDRDSRVLHMAPVSHGSGLYFLPTLFRGGCTITQNLPDLKAWCANVEAEKVTVAGLVPTVLYRLLDLPEASRHDLSSLQTIYYGAAPISPSKLERLQARFGSIFLQIYGSTECLQPVALLPKSDHIAGAGHLASAGRLATTAEVIVVDSGGQRLPAGMTGEVWIRSRATISGYFRNPEGTAAEFYNGFWKSGDLGYVDKRGFLYIVDRKKDMIITGGFNVYAIEVEAALNAHPAVSNSTVIGIPHEEWGEAVHAEVMVNAGEQVSAESLIDHVKRLLGGYKAPKTVAFVDALPVSAVGKVLRRQVRDKYWAGHTRKVS
ncbi:AMP-binding protein [Cupriavidus metallidurans]|uniref:class I adenylate-forming enzyme family protein n=1 Tax=Cupriavidus TaxID=106589 RepID=UPI000E90FA16|nr:MULTISPECIES: AMP-binding protein [unclassified Cupriavidus]GMG95077.1 hypothetical protein Cmtc_62970 [Cupriavidus sp. TKC]HBO79921.1 long-chain fatty acid--CoA ligase [Cupriavidus sp.]